MPTYGKTSQQRLITCHDDLQKIFMEVIKYIDISIIEGIRTTETQQKYFNEGHSQIDGVTKKSYHQDNGSGLSRAVDVCPYVNGLVWDNDKYWRNLAKIVFRETQLLISQGEITHYIEWGGNWRNFLDYPHFEIKPV